VTRRQHGRQKRGNLGGVRHVTSASLDALEPLLEQLRTFPDLIERKRGIFYRRSRAFLHFHEDSTGYYADVRVERDFVRMRVQTDDEQVALLRRIREVCAQSA
jgi:hypothetical protein